MRKGIVLFITLSVIVAMLALVGVIFSYLDKSKKNASETAALIQANLFYHDSNQAVKGLLQKASKDKEMKDTVLSTLYLAPITIQPEEGDIFVTIECSPLNKAVNINWLGYEDNASMQLHFVTVHRVFSRLVEEYDISNATLLLEKITEAIKAEGSVVSENPTRLMQKKGIISLQQLQKIVRDYQFETDDPKIDAIAWEKFFSFDKESTLMDANYLSAELIAILFDLELESVTEEWFEGDELKSLIASVGADASLYNKNLYSEVLTERMHCNVTYSYQDEIYSFGFDYLEEKAEKFEFYGKQ